MGNININGSGTYSTLNSAIAAASGGDTINITGTWSSADTTSVTWDAAVTVVADSDSKQTGVPWSTGSTAYRHRETSGNAFTVSADVDITDISIISDSIGVSDEIFRMSSNVDLSCIKCHLGFSGNTNQQDIVYIDQDSGTPTLDFDRCTFFDVGRSIVDFYRAGITATVNFNSCISYNIGADGGREGGCWVGIDGSSGAVKNVNFHNCVASGIQDSYVVAGDPAGVGTLNLQFHYSLSETTSGNLANQTDTETTTGSDWEYTITENTSPGAGDFVIVNDISTTPYNLQLVDDSDNDAIDFHAVATSAGLTIQTPDIAGNSRPNGTNYDVGPFEIAAAGGGGSKALAGTVASISAFTSSSPILVRSIVGSFAASASISSAPVLRKKPVAGSLGASSSLTGALSRLKLFVGSFASSSTFVGALSRLKLFVGSFAGVSAFSGALSKVATGVKSLAGSIVAVSSVSGGVLLRSRVLQGSFAAVSSFAGRLAGGVKALAGSIAGTSAFSSTISIVAQWKNAIMQGINNETGEHFIIDGKIRYKKEK